MRAIRPSQRWRVAFVLLAALSVAGWWWLRGHADRHEGTEDGGIETTAVQATADELGARAAKGALAGSDWQLTAQSGISGRVLDAGGAPVANATVCAFADERARERPGHTPCSQTDDGGRYSIERLYPGRYAVSASAPRFAPARHVSQSPELNGVRLAPGQTTTGIDIVLAVPGVEVRGVVRDLAGGVVEGAEVSTRKTLLDNVAPMIARSDAEGAFVLWVVAGGINLQARAEGYSEETTSGRAPSRALEIFLAPESVVQGRVVDGDNRPVADARVELGGSGPAMERSGAAFTQPNGTFRIGGLKPGAYKPTAKSDGGYGELAKSVHLGLGETSESLTITLQPATTVSGQVVILDEDGSRGCPDANVSLTELPQLVRTIAAHSRGDGAVLLRGVLPGRYELSVSCTGMVSAQRYDALEVGEQPIEGLRWEVQLGAEIRGHVVEPGGGKLSGADLAGVAVMARLTGEGSLEQFMQARPQDVGPDGAFRLVGLHAGTYKLWLHGQHATQTDERTTVEVGAGEVREHVELELQPEARIVGEVVDPSGRSITGAQVLAMGEGFAGGAQPADERGRFEIGGLPGGTFTVTVNRLDSGTRMRAPGTTDDEKQGQTVAVEPGGEAYVRLIVEARNAHITGRVVGDTGAPVADAYVRARRESDSAAVHSSNARRSARWGGWDEQPNMTDADGSFSIERLSGGPHTLFAWRRGGGEAFLERVQAGSTGIVMTIREPGRIEGRITAAKPGTRFYLSAVDHSTGLRLRESFFATEGAFVLDELPAGTYRLTASSPDASGNAEVTLAEGEVKTGVTIDMARRVRVSGRVLDLITSEPVPGLVVSMRAVGAHPTVSLGGNGTDGTTDENGYFTLGDVPTGAVTVTTLAQDTSNPYGIMNTQTVTVGEQDPFELAPIKLVARRVKPGEDYGDLGFTLKSSSHEQSEKEEVPTIGVVTPNGPAAQAGLKPGDRVHQVDGQDVTSRRFVHFQELTGVAVGATVTFTLSDGSRAKLTAVPLSP